MGVVVLFALTSLLTPTESVVYKVVLHTHVAGGAATAE